ncbi:major core protein [Chlorella virus XW01]|nr:major core protein [Chlorella virus XW01]
MDSSDSYTREKPMKNSGKIDEEVQKLFRKAQGGVNARHLQELRSRHSDVELADKIQAAFIEKHSQILKKAKKFADLIRERYSDTQYPFHLLLAKALKYKQKHNLTDDEFAEFKRIYEQELVGQKSPDVFLPMTNMQKVLGAVNVDGTITDFNISDEDHRYLQEILKLASTSRPLHAQVVLQSIQYKDMDLQALAGQYRPELGHRLGEHVHPVVAALFFPKIDLLEQHFLYSNIANLVRTRYNNERISTRADYELFYNLTRDPNDIVCSNRSPVMDLLNRANLQQQLWNSVLNMRNGQYFNNSFTEFISAIDLCRLNKFDSPDLIYGRHDGTVLKRLVSAFSFRPTVVATTPIFKTFAHNPYHQNVRPSVTSVSMVNMKLPVILNESTPVELKEALENSQLFMDATGKMEYKNTSLIYSRGVLIFYVDRRANVLRLNDMEPFSLDRLPKAVAGFERVNDRQVVFDNEFTIRDDLYVLRSVVCVKTNDQLGSGNVVIGSNTLLRKMRESDAGLDIESDRVFNYDPYTSTSHSTTGESVVKRLLETESPLAPDMPSFRSIASTKGTIFIYQLLRDESKGLAHF